MRSPTSRSSRGGPGHVAAFAALLAAGALLLGACSSASQGTGTNGNNGQQSGSAHQSTQSTGQTSDTSADSPVTAPGLTGAGSGGSSSSPSSQGSSADSSQTSTSTSTSDPTAEMRVTADPSFGSKNVSPNKKVTLISLHSTFKNVQMVGSDGTIVKGKLSDGDQSWTSTDKMKYGTKYEVTGDMVGAQGAKKPFDGVISTVNPKKTMRAAIQIPNDTTVGIAAPIVLTFAGQVTNRAAAEKQLHVTVTDQNGNSLDVTGSWGWVQDEDIHGKGKQSRVHYRPKEFWPAHAKIHVEADLYGVHYGKGEWGRENIVRDFSIGPKLEVKTDVKNHRLIVTKDDQVVKNYPVSYGVAKAGFATVSGIHIVQGKKPGAFTMCNKPFYCDVTEYWGVRINNNGEFVHVNKRVAKEGKLGKANVSHGCINMNMTDGKQFFNMVYYGVPVIVKNAGPPMSWQDYVYDWAPMFMGETGWKKWESLSAL